MMKTTEAALAIARCGEQLQKLTYVKQMRSGSGESNDVLRASLADENVARIIASVAGYYFVAERLVEQAMQWLPRHSPADVPTVGEHSAATYHDVALQILREQLWVLAAGCPRLINLLTGIEVISAGEPAEVFEAVKAGMLEDGIVVEASLRGLPSPAELDPTLRQLEARIVAESRLAEDTERQEADSSQKQPDQPVGKSIPSGTINDRMLSKILTDKECHGWTCRQWAENLGCSASSVSDTDVWKSLTIAREQHRAEHRKDRRRK